MLFSLVTLPTGADFLAGVADTSGASFDEFFPIGVWGIGWVVGSLLAVFVVVIVVVGIKHFFHVVPKAVGVHHDDRGAMRQYVRRQYLDSTDDRSERGDFLHEGQ